MMVSNKSYYDYEDNKSEVIVNYVLTETLAHSRYDYDSVEAKYITGKYELIIWNDY